MVHNSDVLFPSNSTNQTVGSDIISAIVTGVENVKNLAEPVVLEFSVSVVVIVVVVVVVVGIVLCSRKHLLPRHLL